MCLGNVHTQIVHQQPGYQQSIATDQTTLRMLCHKLRDYERSKLTQYALQCCADELVCFCPMSWLATRLHLSPELIDPLVLSFSGLPDHISPAHHQLF